MPCIENILARQVLDSRGHPTVEVDVHLDSGAVGRTSVPSGASTGSHEATELRDNGAHFKGRSVFTAIRHIQEDIFEAVRGIPIVHQQTLDEILCALDGTLQKSRLGANAILAVSLAFAKACAQEYDIPLYAYLGGHAPEALPIPFINVINGGAHADNPLDIQEFMIVPRNFHTYSGAIEASFIVYQSIRDVLKERKLGINVGDEGGFAPTLASTHETLSLIDTCIKRCGYEKSISIALDVAASELYNKGTYSIDGHTYTSEELLAFYRDLISQFPIVSIEDPFHEDDWDGFKNCTASIGESTYIVGDDLYVTHRHRLEKGVSQKASNSILIKPNQVGTISETLSVIRYAQRHGITPIISHRSGETADTSIIDIAIATQSPYVKIGGLSRMERIEKYNTLLRLEDMNTIPYWGANECDQDAH